LKFDTCKVKSLPVFDFSGMELWNRCGMLKSENQPPAKVSGTSGSSCCVTAFLL